MSYVNPLLQTMDVHDINRRYVNTFVRYDREIAYVDEIMPVFGGGCEISLINVQGRQSGKFDYRKLDISRPSPRWIQHKNKPYYLNYLYERQWHRGFCRQNAAIRTFQQLNLLPDMICLELLQKFYDEPWIKPSWTMAEVKEQLQKNDFVLLSPTIVVYVGDVFFREKYIGGFGSVDKNFVQEMKELVRDYINEDAKFAVGVDAKAAKRPMPGLERIVPNNMRNANQRRVVQPNLRPRDIFDELDLQQDDREEN